MRVESYPSIEPEEDIAEQPDLLAAYGEQTATVYGVSGSLKDLSDLCPIDPSDPRRSVEANNEFVIKVANEAGLAIAPEHEPLFTHVLEKYGLERKITIASPDIIQKDEREKSQATNTIGINKDDKNPASKQKAYPTTSEVAEAPAKISEKVTDGSKLIMAQEKSENPMQNEALVSAEVMHSADLPIEILIPAENRKQTADGTSTAGAVALESAQSLHIEAEKSLPPRATATSPVERTARHPKHVTEQEDYNEQPLIQSSSNLPLQSLEIEPEPLTTIKLEEISPSPHDEESTTLPGQIEQLDMRAVGLEEEPIKVYEDFTQALQTFISHPRSIEAAQPNTENEPYSEAENQETPAAPTIAILVAETLAELEPNRQVDVIPLLQALISANTELERLDISSGKASPEATAAAEAHLKVAIAVFFEAIGIEYKVEDVQEFTHLLQHLDIQVSPIEIDLAHVGTHEAKTQRLQLIQNLTDAEHSLQQLVGRLAFFCLKGTSHTASIPASAIGQLSDAA